MTQAPQSSADIATISAHLHLITRRWVELGQPAMLELRAFAENRTPQTAKFRPDWIDEPEMGAAAWAAEMNALRMNVYAVINPIRDGYNGSAKDTDILGSFYLWADCDDENAARNVRSFVGPKWTAAVTTGTIPTTRAHVYWELEEPCLNLDAWRAMQSDIAATFQSDRSVINPSRIMRLAGTVTYPDTKKQGRGYVQETAKLRTEYDDGRAPIAFDRIRQVFAPQAPVSLSQQALAGVTPQPGGMFQIDTGGQYSPPLDRERATIQALSGMEWHNAMIRLVASYVSRGLSDGEIHALTDPLTLAGYTVEETRAEVQTAIDGARRKGWTPQTYASPESLSPAEEPQDTSWDAPSQPASDDRMDLEWYDDISPALGADYIVKGVIDQATMSVIYGPSNSGKTFFTLDMAFHIACGAPWRGKRVRQAAVLYLASEGGRGIKNRIAALRQTTGLCDIPFALKRAGLDLLRDQADLQAIVNLSAIVKAKAEGAPLLIVIDTLSRVMAGGDENSAQDMTALIRNIDGIRAMTGAHIMLVHHTGKDTARGARGHSSLRAATDTEIEVGAPSEGEDARMAMVTKQRDYSGNDSFAFTLKQVLLGQDDDGDDVVTCVVETADTEAVKTAIAQKKGLGGNQKIIADTFDQMIAEGLGKPNPGGVGFPDPGRFMTVPLADLRAHATGKMTADNKRGAFSEAWRALTEGRGLFCIASELVWRTDKPLRG